MSDQPTLQIQPRTARGTQEARRMRRAGRVPGALYGHGEPLEFTVDARSFAKMIPPGHYGSAMVRVQLDGRDLGIALVKIVQTNPLKGQIMSVELQRVAAEDRIHVTVPVMLTGDPVSVRAGGVLEQNVHVVNLRCRAADAPAELTFDVTPLQIGDSIHAGQLALPAGSELLDRADEVIAVVLPPTIPAGEEPVIVNTQVSGPQLTGEKQKDDFPPEH